jgi:putative tryptophan/tyrosine transport system substrate-binding protein
MCYLAVGRTDWRHQAMKRREFIALLGGAAAWPLAARAQQGATPSIGFLSTRSLEDSKHLVSAFRRGLQEGNFAEGRNLTIEFRWAGGKFELLPAMAADLVSRHVNVLAAVGGEPAALAAQRSTSTIPVVFSIGSDPVRAGLVDSFNRPTANLTGVTLQTVLMEPKRLGLLRDVVPGAALVGVLIHPNFALAAMQLQEIQEAARSIGQRIVVMRAGTDEELDAAFVALAKERASALLVAGSPYFDTQREHIIRLTKQQRLPAIYQFREFAIAGGLMSYGISITEGYRQVGIYTAKILNGAKPTELPVQSVSKFELVINLRTAKDLGVQISDNLLSLADEVIE